MRKINYWVLTFLIVCITSCSAQKSTNTLEELNNKVDEIYLKSDIPGFSVVVVNDKDVLYQYSQGYADIASNKKFDDNTVLNIASISKTFIGVALMKAVDHGKINLDDNINLHLPFKVTHPKYPNTVITIRHLANHTSGIIDGDIYTKSYVFKNPDVDISKLPKEVKTYAELMKQNKKMDESEFLKFILSKEGIWYSKDSFSKDAPGSNYSYSNIGATLAAFVIENAVGIPYEEYVRQYIFKPLEMEETGWNSSEVSLNNYATRYLSKDMPIPDYEIITKADGGIITNTTDFAKYLIEMINGFHGKGTLLAPNTYKEMFTRKEFGKESSGIFWGVSKSGNPNHSGSDPGVITIASVNPRTNLGIFFMSNIDIDSNRKMMKKIIKILNTIKTHNWK